MTTITPWWETETTLDRKAVRDALWAAILNKIDELTKTDPGKGHAARTMGFYSVDGMQCMTRATISQYDGSEHVYHLTACYRGDHWTAFNLGKVDNVLVEPSYHSNEWFWEPIIAEAATDRLRAVIDDDQCYSVQPDSSQPGRGDGFSGAPFTITWLDDAGQPTGETTRTRNLWYRGTIPPKFRDQLKPNATVARD